MPPLQAGTASQEVEEICIMIGFRHSIASTGAALLLGIGSWGLASPAAAACSCMCVDEVAYEVCTGIVTTQGMTAECTAQLDCAAVPAPEPTESEPPVEPPATAGNDLDCRRRNVYRPDLGRYKPYTVCMPAQQAAAHERLRTKRAEMAAQYAALRADHNHRSHRGNGPHQRWHDGDGCDDDKRSGRRRHDND